MAKAMQLYQLVGVSTYAKQIMIKYFSATVGVKIVISDLWNS